MPVELLVILGAEASILACVAAMSLHAKRMDVLSRRSFERPIVFPRSNKHLARSIRRKARGLRRLTGRWAISSRSSHWISCGAMITRMLRRILQTRPQTPVRFETRACWTSTPAPGACGRPADFQELIATPAPKERAPVPTTCSRVRLPSCTSSALLECPPGLILQRLEQV